MITSLKWASASRFWVNYGGCKYSEADCKKGKHVADKLGMYKKDHFLANTMAGTERVSANYQRLGEAQHQLEGRLAGMNREELMNMAMAGLKQGVVLQPGIGNKQMGGAHQPMMGGRQGGYQHHMGGEKMGVQPRMGAMGSQHGVFAAPGMVPQHGMDPMDVQQQFSHGKNTSFGHRSGGDRMMN